MDLFDRYLSAVRANLPAAQADDIVAEIGDDLQSQADEREAQLGRALTDDDAVAILRAYGNPRIVAARYAQHQALIGPALLPFYWYALRTVAVVVVAVELAGGAFRFDCDRQSRLVLSQPRRRVEFALLCGRHRHRHFCPDRTRTAAALASRRHRRYEMGSAPVAGTGFARVPYSTSIANTIANGVFFLILLDLGGLRHQFVTMMTQWGSQTWPFVPTAAWQPFYITLLISSFVLAATGIVTLVRPRWSTLYSGVMVATNCLVIVGAALTLRAAPLVTPGSPPLEQLCSWSLGIAIAIAAVTAAIYAFALLRKKRVAGGSKGTLSLLV